MSYTADPGTRIGHVHLKVSDLDRSVAFYRDVIGLDVVQHYGNQAAFLSAGGYHHHIGLNVWHSKGNPPADRRHPGLYHTAFLYPTIEALGRAVRHVRDSGVEIYGHADHGVSLAVYFDDPDGNGIEMYWDKPEDQWPRDADGTLQMVNDRFSVEDLIEGRLS